MDTQHMDLSHEKYLTYMGRGGKKLLHSEHWSHPDAETYLTGIDYYDHPKLCREKMRELYPLLALGIPATDDPKPRPKLGGDGLSSDPEKHTVRWGDGETDSFTHGEVHFKDIDEVLRFSPLENAADFVNWNVVENWDFSVDDDTFYNQFRVKKCPWLKGDKAEEGKASSVWYYNTMFMWPLLTFGYENFMACCLDDEFERIMDEFAELNRKVFRAIARLPVNFVTSHDDIVMTNGPVCSPKWMHKYIFPRYEEFWSILKAAGKEVIFQVDGKVDCYADDVLACGARGIDTEPYTNFKEIARKHQDCFLAGEGDNRIINRNNPDEIRAMVESMVETGKMSRGYMLSAGNHLPWNVNVEGVKRYLDLCDELGYR
jgi:hypothetical protein